jgi:hypothetical protein
MRQIWTAAQRNTVRESADDESVATAISVEASFSMEIALRKPTR